MLLYEVCYVEVNDEYRMKKVFPTLDRLSGSPTVMKLSSFCSCLHAAYTNALQMRRPSVKKWLLRAGLTVKVAAPSPAPTVLAASWRASTSRNTIEYELQTLAQQQSIFQAYLQRPSTRPSRLRHSRQLSTSSRSHRERTVQEAEDAAESGGAPQHVSERLLRKFAESPPNYGELITRILNLHTNCIG